MTVLDGHSHTLSFVAGIRGDRIACLDITECVECSNLEDAYELHSLDLASIGGVAFEHLGRESENKPLTSPRTLRVEHHDFTHLPRHRARRHLG